MKHIYFRFLTLILISLFIISCGQKPLEDINFAKGNYKMYFFIPPSDPDFAGENEFQNEFKNFYIEDRTVLEKIKNQVIKEKVTERVASPAIYILRLEKDRVVVDGGILFVETNEILYYKGKYRFDFSELEKFKSSFKKLNSFEINCLTASNTQKFIEFVESSNGFIYGAEKESTSYKDYKGKIDLLTNSSNLNPRESGGWEKIENNIKNDFKELGEIKIIYLSFHSADSLFVSLLLKDDFTSQIPEEYEILSPFTDTVNMPVQVIDIERDKIVNFFKSNDISEYKIKELN